VPSEGSAVLCTTEDPVGSEAEGVFLSKSSYHLPLFEGNGLRHSFMPINRQSSLPTLSYRVGLLTRRRISRWVTPIIITFFMIFSQK
jgi:hypothetical protein